MRRFIPHFVIFGLAGLTVLIGFGFHSIVIAKFVGFIAASAIDPPNLVVASLFGGAIARHIILFPSLILLGVSLAIIVAHLNSSLGAQLSVEIILAKAVAAILVGYAANLVRALIVRKQKQRTSQDTNHAISGVSVREEQDDAGNLTDAEDNQKRVFLKRFNTSIKRAGFLVFVAGSIGLVALFLWFLAFEWRDPHFGRDPLLFRTIGDFFDDFGRFIGRSRNGEYAAWFYASVVITVIGFALAYQYERIIKPVLRWIKTGVV